MSINKEIKAINKDKELTASDKNERMARYYQRIESLDKEDATYERRKSDIANKQESLNETMSGSEGEITNLEKRISELESKRESYKILQSRIKNEEKLVKSQMVK